MLTRVYSARSSWVCVRRIASPLPRAYSILPWFKSVEDDKEDKSTVTKTVNPNFFDPITGDRRKGINFNYKMELNALSHRIGFSEEQLPSLQVALTHSSVLSKVRPFDEGNKQHNSRLATLGKTSLAHYLQEFLYHAYPNMLGNFLKDINKFLLTTQSLASIAHHLGIPELVMTKYKLEDPAHVYVISDAFCAVVGAIYVDQGPLQARKFIRDFVASRLRSEDVKEIIKIKNPVLMLQTLLRIMGKPRAVPRLINESGRLTHFPSFIVGMYSGEELLAEGCGTSLIRAKQEAASAALRKHFFKEAKVVDLPSDFDEFEPDSIIPLARELNNDIEH